MPVFLSPDRYRLYTPKNNIKHLILLHYYFDIHTINMSSFRNTATVYPSNDTELDYCKHRPSVNVENEPRITGRVKWFNNATGFGFITVCDGEHTGKDIFVHYSSIQVQNSQYKYLVQGEYVDFNVMKPDNSLHEYHAVSVSGIKGGNLMCETWNANRSRRDFRTEEN